MTADAVIDGAMKLTTEHGLDGWSTRMLASHLDTSLSVIAHHVGDRHALSAAVVDRVAAEIVVPDDSASWQSWIRGLLLEIRRTFQPYPGVAQWVLHHGPATPSIAPILDRGVSTLIDAGFGRRAPQAYTVATTTAIALIAMSDARRHTGAPHHHIATTMKRGDAGVGLAALAGMVTDFAEHGVSEHYSYTLETIVAGLESQLRSG